MTHGAEHDLLEAEVLGFPLASKAAFDLRLLALGRREGVLDKATQALSRAVEDRLRPLAFGQSLDRHRSLCVHAWFGAEPPQATRPLAAYLGDVAASALIGIGGHVELRRDGDHLARVRRYRWLSLVLPADLLVAALAARDGFSPRTDRVSLMTPQLAKVLLAGVADTHLHVGAGFSFGLLWAGLMRSLGDAPPTPNELDKQGPPPFGDGARFLKVLQCAAIARLLMGIFLARRAPTESFGGFRDVGLLDFAKSVPWAPGAKALRRLLWTAFDVVESGDGPTRSAVFGAMYKRILGRAALPGPRSAAKPEDVVRRDPLARWFLLEGTAVPVETRFAAEALRYLGGEGLRDRPFAKLFWQYERVRCLTHRHVVQEPGVVGLDWFQRHFRRLSPLKRGVGRASFASALKHQGEDLTLASLEGRTSPEARWWSNVRTVRDLAGAVSSSRNADGPELALVLHFVKDDAPSDASTKLRLGDPRDHVFGARFGRWLSGRQKELRALTTMLEQKPETLALYRGFDVASSELSQPLWPLVRLLKDLRKASQRAAAVLARTRPSWGVGPLRATFHVGEDFRRLVDGLRRMHELVETGILGVGDRVGHGLALGTDAEDWLAQNPRVLQPREERLDDLLWELDRYGLGDLPASATRLARAGREAFEHASVIYGCSDDPIEPLIEARRMRHDLCGPFFGWYPYLMRPEPRQARAAIAERAKRDSSSWGRAHDLLEMYLTNGRVFDRGQELVEVAADASELGLLQAAQRWLRRKLAALEITIESNPSSNLLIGNYGLLERHPAFVLSPLAQDAEAAAERVMLSINVDDPITFASRLADEHAYLHAALLGSKVSTEDALAWLERCRETGLRSRFSLPASKSREVLDAILGPYRVERRSIVNAWRRTPRAPA